MSTLFAHGERDKIHTYLKSLGRYLSRLESYEADEVLREIESHVYDAIDLTEAKGESADIEQILAGFRQAYCASRRWCMVDGGRQ